MKFFNRNKHPAEVNRGMDPSFASAGKIPISEAGYSLLQANQLIERTLAFIKFTNKNPNPFETMTEFIVHLVNAHTLYNGVTIVKSGAYYYVADVIADTGLNGKYQFTSNLIFTTRQTLTEVVDASQVWTVYSSQIATMQRVSPETNSLLRNAINTVLRRLSSLGKINLIWQKKGWKDLETQKAKNEADLSTMGDMMASSGGVMTASVEDKFFQVQPDYSKADGTEVAGSIAIFSYVTGISPEFLRGAQSDQQTVNSVMQIVTPLLNILAEKVPYFEYRTDFSQLATLQQSQSKTTGDSRVQTIQAVKSQGEA